MAIRINKSYLSPFVSEADIEAIKGEVENALITTKEKTGRGNDFLGWYDLPLRYETDEYSEIKKAAEQIKKDCDVLIVIGIGGSYLGARAAIEFIKSPIYNSLKKDTPEIYFSGNNISSSQMKELLSICEGKDVCVNVISKSGKTTEPAIAFRMFREFLEKKYGEDEARKRIYVTTDKAKGALKVLADQKGYKTFVVPDDIGGRYSVLTPVGLLPIAVAGCDLDRIMQGAKKAQNELTAEPFETNSCLQYAAIRNILYRSGKKVEIMACYESAYALMAEWWKQLFGESEGKDGVGILPDSVIYSTDLHSLGQIVQQGERNIFETVVDILKSNDDVVIPSDEDDLDELNYIAGKTMHEVNRTATEATIIAHSSGSVPNIVLELDSRSEEDFGYMVYFFELACSVSGYVLGINPFDQPGVEAYKNNMFALLGKKGEKFDKIRSELKK